jgi:hypothetical protein
MTSGDDHDVRGFVRRNPGHRLVKVFSDHLARFWETLAIGVGVAIVGDAKWTFVDGILTLTVDLRPK